jgi:hypothetical protein
MDRWYPPALHASGTYFAHLKKLEKALDPTGGFMASETELFYLVLLTLLTLIIHLILSTKHRRDDKHSHA